MEKRALSGVRVLEAGQYIAGPVAGKMLADMGAEVVKLEMPPIGDYTRGYGGQTGPAGFSSGFRLLESRQAKRLHRSQEARKRPKSAAS